MKPPEPGNKAQRKVEKLSQKLSAEIFTENYELVYQSRRKCEIYRDTGVTKINEFNGNLFIVKGNTSHSHAYQLTLFSFAIAILNFSLLLLI